MLRIWRLCSATRLHQPCTITQVFQYSTRLPVSSTSETPKAYGDAVTRLRLTVPPHERVLKSGEGVGGGREGRMMQLRRIVSSLFDLERIELRWYEASEARLYAERLIQEAIKASAEQDMNLLLEMWLDNRTNEPVKMDTTTLELACFWLTDPYLVEKLFKVFVPRYRFYDRAYTRLLRTQSPPGGPPIHNPMDGSGILELRGNPWPPIHSRGLGPNPEPFKRQYLINVLIQASKQSVPAAHPNSPEPNSSST